MGKEAFKFSPFNASLGCLLTAAEGSGKRDGIIKRDTFSFVPAKPALLIQSVVSRLSSCDAKLKSIATKISPIEQPSS